MANTSPRRQGTATQRARGAGATPWEKDDPTRKFGLNVQIGEPLMCQLDYLVENKVIFSKASFIRDVVEKACEEEIKRLNRVREAIKRLDAEEKRRK